MCDLKRTVALVVDDEIAITKTLAAILNRAGFDARAMFSGEEAVESLATIQPDFLITDVVMGRMNGIELAIIVRSKFPNCKILLLSGQVVTTDMLETARAQGYEFDILAKPIHPTHLLAQLCGE